MQSDQHDIKESGIENRHEEMRERRIRREEENKLLKNFDWK
jgi:hypothetical protein